MKTGRHVIQALLLLSLWLGGMMAVQAQTRTVHSYYTDPQGTVLAKTDAQGNILARYDYTPYGGSVASLGSPPDGPGYTGHVNDPETGLVYMQARYYLPIGRFPSPDPMGPVPGNVYSFNRYAYANNNPIVNTDPTGAFPGDKNDCSGSAFPCFVSGGESDGGKEGDDPPSRKQNLSDVISASINQLDVGGDAHDVLQAYAVAFSQNYFAERWTDPNGVFFGGRPDIGNVFTKELWEIKSAMSASGAGSQLDRYAFFSHFTYKAGGLPSFFRGSSTLSLPGIYATYNYQFEGRGVITYTFTLKQQYRYQTIGRGFKPVIPKNPLELLEALKAEPIPVFP